MKTARSNSVANSFSRILQTNKIPEKPEPEIEHSAPSVTHLLGIDWLQQSCFHIVSDLGGKVLLQKLLDLLRIELEHRIIRNRLLGEHRSMRCTHCVEGQGRAYALNMSLRQKFERIRERVVPCRENLPILRAGH